MRTSFFIILLILFTAVKVDTKTNFVYNFFQPKTEVVVELTLEEKLDTLLQAIIQVETKGKNISGDNGAAAGILQIHKIQVDEVNRIAKLMGKKERFSYKDRWNEEKSKQMFFITVEYWHEDLEFEKIARCWNGGPTGHRKKATLHYWKKVQFELEKQELLAEK
mgnify:CR=1 FL=1|jgi:hypothetical protein